MSKCPQCGATVPEGAVHCGNCEAATNEASKTPSSSQPKIAAQESTVLQDAPNGDLSVRLEKAMRRNELLTYAAAGLGLAILAVIIIISLL